MNEIINYFSTIPSSHRALILAGGIAFFWLIETAVPLFKFSYNKRFKEDDGICSAA